MDDEFIKDLANQILSGSLTSETEETTVTEAEEYSTQAILDSVIESEWIESQLVKNNIPYYLLLDPDSDSQHFWILNALERIMTKMPSGSELIPMEKPGSGKTYCMIGDCMFLIPDNLIQYVGWN